MSFFFCTFAAAKVNNQLTYSFRGRLFPMWIANYSIIAYFMALVSISVVFSAYAMQWYWWLFGIIGVGGFFLLTSYYSKVWRGSKEKVFKKNIFISALLIRVIMVFFLYWFFDFMTGQPYMFESADEQLYNEWGTLLADGLRHGGFSGAYRTWRNEEIAISDSGFPIYVGIVYYLTGNSVVALRLLNALFGALTCTLIYTLGRRNFGENVGRLAALFILFEPHFIIYCGLHLKEVMMLFFLVLFLERADILLRSRNFKFKALLPAIMLLTVLFTFRTALGIAVSIAVVMALLFTNKRVASLQRRWLLLILFVLCAGIFVGGRIATEVEELWQQRNTNQELRMTHIRKSQSMAQYATKTVMAPMIFTIPFPTMVETKGQENHRMLHAGYVVKNVMSFFCIFALIVLVLNSSTLGWRNNVLLGAFLLSYLLIIIQSAFIHSDRFHLPAYIIELLFAAYGVGVVVSKKKFRRWFALWSVVMYIAWMGWAYFKLAGRGVIE